MHTVNTLFRDAVPGRTIEFKRKLGNRGKPAQGKVISRSPKGLTVEAANGQLEHVRKNLIRKVVIKRGRPAKVDPYLLARAKMFEKELHSA